MPAASRATSSSACTAWARRSIRRSLREMPDVDLPRLCAGRRPCRSARLSGAPAAGERRQFLLRVGGRRSGGADRRPSCERPQSWIARSGAGAPSAYSAAARPVRAGAAAIRPASNSATARRSTRCSRRSARHRQARSRAADRRRRRRTGRARSVASPIDGTAIGAGAARAMRRSSPPPCRRRRPDLRLERDAGRRARRRARCAPAT